MILQQNTTDNDYIFMRDREKDRYDDEVIASLKRKKQKVDLDLAENIRRRKEAMNKWEGHDEDKDYLGDSREIEVGLHDLRNVPQHKPINRLGPTTPQKGTAFATGSNIIFQYNNDHIDLNVRPVSNIGGVHKMKAPKPMKLSVDFGKRHEHTNGMKAFTIDLDVNPQNYRMNSGSIKGINIGGTLSKMDQVATKHKAKIGAFGTSFNSKNLMKTAEKKNKNEINDLSSRLTSFLSSQKKQKEKKKSGVELTAGSKLDFSIVGIVKSKKKGVI